MPRAVLSIRYILFNLEELEREDTFRLKRFQQLKRKNQSGKDEGKKDVDGDITEPPPPVVKFEDNREDKPTFDFNDFNELGKIIEEKDIANVMEMIEESLTEPNITFNNVPRAQKKEPDTIINNIPQAQTKEPEITQDNVPHTDKNELKMNEKRLGKSIDEPKGTGIDGKVCSCPPLFVAKPQVCQAKLPDPIFIIQKYKALQEFKAHKEYEIKTFDEIKATIPMEVQPCCSEIVSTWLKKYLEEMVSECVCNSPKSQREDIAACSQNIHKYAKGFSKLSVDDSIFSVNSKFEDKLGSYESEYKEIIKISRIPNEDGTIRQKRKIVTVRTDKRNPMKTKSVDSQNITDNDHNLVCSCSDSSHSGENDNNTKSDPDCNKCQLDKSNLRSCLSTGSMKNTTKVTTVPCCYPSLHRVNITINDNNCEEHNIIKTTRLPLVSSISVNYCDLPKNIMFDLRSCQGRDCQGLCNDTNQPSKQVVDADLLDNSPEFKKSGSCLCEDKDLETAEKCSQTFNKEGVEVDGMLKNASTGTTSTTYVFKNVVVSLKHSSEDRENTALQSPDYSYIFSRVKKVRHDLLDKKIEETHPAVHRDIFFKECNTRSTMFAYILSSYQRIEIDDMVKRACFDIPEFPYIFSKISTNTPCIPCNTKSVEIGDLFNNACKPSYNCSYIFNHLKNIQINAMIKHSCMNKVDFPYIFSTVKPEIEDRPNKDATLRTAEIEKMFKNIHKPVTDLSYILNHVKTVKIDNMFKEACKHYEHFPYVFSNVTNKTGSRETLQKIKQMFDENCKQSCKFPYIFSSSNKINNNYIPCENIGKKINKCSYIFSKASETILKNDEEFKQTCMPDEKISAVLNKVLFKKSVQTFKQESLTRLKEISDLFKESVRSMNSDKYKFKYVYKNKLANDVDKKTSTDMIYIYTICDASTSTDKVDWVTNNPVLKQTCKQRNEYIYFPNEVECRKTNIVQRASETTLQDMQKILKDPCNCIIDSTQIKTAPLEKRCNAECGTTDSSKKVNIEHLERPSEKFNVVDINNMFEESCVRKNEFTYILNKPASKQSCELARRTTDLRLQQVSKLENIVKNDWGNLNIINVKKHEPKQFTKTPNLLKIDNMFKDSCVQKNSFTYVLNNLESKVSCELARRTSELRRREVEKLSNTSKPRTCGLDTCTVCNPDRCLNLNYIKIDKMIKKACTQKNEFTYVFTKLGMKPIQLARRTSHLQLHEISKINESHSSKVAGSKMQDTESSKTDFTQLLRKALESVEMIKSNCEKYRNVATFYDTSIYENDNKYLLNKVNESNTFGLTENARAQKKQEMDKMFKDSCTTSPNPKYNYIFQKVLKPHTCTCIRKKIELKPPCCISYSDIDYEHDELYKIEAQSSGSFLVTNRRHRFLIEIPNSKDSLETLGIEVMWKSSGITEQNIAPKSIHITTSKRSLPTISSVNSENKINEKMSWCRHTCNKFNKTPSHSNDVSLIRRMIDSVKNVYVPFLKASVAEVKKEELQPKADNVVSLISNSTTSTYSWKSCTMKTCQADIECVEKNISYSGFSYGSSLDFVSYKSEGVGSEFNSAIECVNTEENAPCTHMKGSNTAEKLLTFDIEMKSGSSLDTKDSVISVKNYSIKFDKNVSDHCQRCGRIKNKPKPICSKCNVEQNRHVLKLSKSPIPSSTRTQNKNLSRRTCSSISITTPKYVNEPKADHWYNMNNRKKFVWTSTECLRASEQNVNRCKQPIRKCRSYDENDSCCSQHSRSFH